MTWPARILRWVLIVECHALLVFTFWVVIN